MVRQWVDAVKDRGVAGELDPRRPQRCEDVASIDYFREYVVAIGEMVRAYQATLDPDVLRLTFELQWVLEVPWHCVKYAATFPVFHDQWFSRYYALTGDPRVLDRVHSWLDAGYESLPAQAFAYQRTGDAEYLRRGLPRYYDVARTLYRGDDDVERYHGFSLLTQSNHGSRFIQQAPYFMAALDAAAIPERRGTDPGSYPASFAAESGAFTAQPPKGWTRSSLTVLVEPLDEPMQHVFELRGARGVNTPSGVLRVFGPPARPGPSAWRTPRQPILSASYCRSLAGVGRLPPCDIELPRKVAFATEPKDGLHAIELAKAAHLQAPLSVPKKGGRPREAAVLRRSTFENGALKPRQWLASGRMALYARPPGEHTIRLKLAAFEPTAGERALPAGIEIEDAVGTRILDTTLFSAGERKAVEVMLFRRKRVAPF
jgi:hypothetical protein